MKYFTNVRTLEELRKEYKRLVKQYHPDNGGDTETVKEINAEYDKMFKILENGSANKKDFDIDLDAAIREAINNIINLNVNIEICGTWIWISGNTYKVKEELKAAGFKWCSNKKMWSWHFGVYARKGNKKTDMAYIRNKYGSQIIKSENRNRELTDK